MRSFPHKNSKSTCEGAERAGEPITLSKSDPDVSAAGEPTPSSLARKSSAEADAKVEAGNGGSVTEAVSDREPSGDETSARGGAVSDGEPAASADDSAPAASPVVATEADRRWAFWMEFCGRHFRCHQLPERSFFIHGYQFPLCARCTGIYLGHIIAFAVNPFITMPLWIALLLLPLILDGTIQYFTTYRSNQFKRFTTGLLFGYALISVLFTAARLLIAHFL